nr:peroxidase skpo-1-like [Parasteatoda tepidariorum]
MVVKPGSIVKFKVPILPEIENFSNQEAKLEDITDRAHQAGITEKLLQNPEVQTTIERCKNFYVPLVCSDTPYRSMDGSCNNLNHPYWGKAVTEQRRLLPANYEGTNGIRKSVNGKDLPLSRRLSLSVRNISNSSTLVSALFPFFGQFITHDMTLTPAMTGLYHFSSFSS